MDRSHALPAGFPRARRERGGSPRHGQTLLDHGSAERRSPGARGNLHGLVLRRHLEGLYGTSYGILLLAKIYLLLVMLLMGAGNWFVVQRLNTDPQPLLARLRRFAEAEIGLGFTVILAAASMSSQPPAVDVPDQVSLQVIAARMHPRIPRMKSPAASQLTPPTSHRNRGARNRVPGTPAPAMPRTANGRSTTITGPA